MKKDIFAIQIKLMAYLIMKKTAFFISLIFTNIILVLSLQSQSNSFNDNNKSETIVGLIKLAEVHLDNKLDSSLILGDKAFNLSAKQDLPEYQYQAAKILADAWYYKDSLSKAINYYRIAADLIKEMEGESSDKYASRISDIGFCFYQLGIYDLAVEYYLQALKIFKETNNTEEISNQLNNIGTVYFNWSNFKLAIEYFNKALALDAESGDSLALSSSYNNIGKVYEGWGFYDLAIDHFNKSLNYLGNTGNEAKKAIRMSNIGTSYYRKADFVKALENIYKALEIDQQLDNTLKIGIRYNEIAMVLTAQEKYSEAIDYNKKALEIFQSINYQKSEAIVLKDLGACYLKSGNYKLAEDYLLQSISITKKIGAITDEMSAHKMLVEVYKNNGHALLALESQISHDKLKDSVFNKESLQQLTNNRIKYETAKKEKENQILKKDIIIKKRTQRTLIIIGGFMLFSTILLIFLLRLRSQNYNKDKKLSNLELEKKEIEKYHLQDKVFAEQQLNRLQREKYETEIQLKNRELVSSTLQLVNKNEVLSEVKNKLKLNNNKIPDEAYKDLMQLINQNTDFDQNWKRFSVEFEKINPGFFDRFKRNYPDFSEQLIRLSAFLRIDLSTKEIARLMNVSVAAVNKNRQRLRKKLNLEAEADLSTFMKSI